jgi:hypothetical protein
MREDLEALCNLAARSPNGLVTVRLSVLMALVDVVDAGDKLTGYAVGVGLPRARNALRAAVTDSVVEP